MSDLLARLPLERINREAREVHPVRTLLTLIAAVLFGLGWLAAKTVAVLWLAAAWSATAVKVGWQEARAPRREGGG